MVLTLTQMKERAKKFSEDFKDASDERSEAQEYWIEFFKIFGIEKRRTKITFEYAITKIEGNKGFIDCFWPGLLIIEHKSLGKNLDMAYDQLLEYTWSLSSSQVPRYAIVSDFQNIRLIDFDEDNKIKFSLSELDEHIEDFQFIYSADNIVRPPQKDLEIKASKIMAKLHDALRDNNYPEEDLEPFLTRLLFCLYAEDTGIFNRFQFRDYIFGSTNDEMINAENNFEQTGEKIIHLFRTLDKAPEDRQTTLSAVLMNFPYVNGNLFSQRLDTPSFNEKMFYDLKEACDFNWADISPAIFGSLYQYIMDEDIRRQQGAHYTDESNVMKVINSLFLNDLWKDFYSAGNNIQKLTVLRDKLGKLRFLDPACGCGNFLIISYRELRLLELEILKKILEGGADQKRLSSDKISVIRVENFYGIEISDYAVNIAKIAMWFIEHQMNLKFDSINFHESNLPLKTEVNIIKGNALRIDWEDVLTPNDNVYVLSNPPFAGKTLQTSSQKDDMKYVFEESLLDGESEFKKYNNLDYVTAWYKKALNYIKGTNIEVAFVSTNSICQGEQVPILWKQLHEHYDFYINFAHQTFRWSNEAERNAGVFVIIIGFSMKERDKKYLFSYETPNSKFETLNVKNINSYLLDYGDLIIDSRRTPICDVPPIKFGSMPNDGGNLILTEREKIKLCHDEPTSKNFIKKFIGAKEYLSNENPRWCLWLLNASPSELNSMPSVLKRVEKVKEHRLQSTREATRELADTPTIFGEIRQPSTDYILIPLNTSENRDYIPIGFVDKDIILNNSSSFIGTDDKFIFGIITSKMHMSWVNHVCGRLEGRYRYSNTIVYNNFPFPTDVSENQKNKVINCVDLVLEAREEFPNEPLTNLYNPQLMPPSLKNAHKFLDKEVDKCYRHEKFKDEMDRMRFLFDLYLKYTSD